MSVNITNESTHSNNYYLNVIVLCHWKRIIVICNLFADCIGDRKSHFSDDEQNNITFTEIVM